MPRYYLKRQVKNDKEIFYEMRKKYYNAELSEHESIDELMLPIVQILKNKGYPIIDSCSGHLVPDIDENCGVECIITFDECNIKFDMNIDKRHNEGFIDPQNFVIEKGFPGGDYGFCIRRFYHDDIDLYTQILHTMLELYEWARSLPKRKCEDNNT